MPSRHGLEPIVERATSTAPRSVTPATWPIHDSGTPLVPPSYVDGFADGSIAGIKHRNHDDCYVFADFALFRYVDANISDWMALQPSPLPMYNMTLCIARKTSCILNMLLSIAALHLTSEASTAPRCLQSINRAEVYRSHAAQLKTLALLQSRQQIVETPSENGNKKSYDMSTSEHDESFCEKSIVPFLFDTLVSHWTLIEILRCERSSIAHFMNSVAESTLLLRGSRIVAGAS